MNVTPAEIRKALVAFVAFLTQLVALGALPEAAKPYAVAVIAALAAVGVYVVPNAVPAPEVEDVEGEHEADPYL